MGLQPSPEGYEVVCRSLARTMVSESAAKVQACLPQTRSLWSWTALEFHSLLAGCQSSHKSTLSMDGFYIVVDVGV